MLIYAQERGNSYGCIYVISFCKVDLVVMLVWKDDDFVYNEAEIRIKLNEMTSISSTTKLSILQFIEKTNDLLHTSYKELL
ncbi:hypothetical protein ENFA_14c01120 [Enterococcus faecalis]|jgi:copper homeostasis protein CutC|nr:hypothetical protein [Enterococcus faecalis]NVJ44328.1 hypothetical protein [Enterococcus faecalis]